MRSRPNHLGGWTGLACDLQVNQDKITCLFYFFVLCLLSKEKKSFFFETKGESFILKTQFKPPPFLCFSHLQYGVFFATSVADLAGRDHSIQSARVGADSIVFQFFTNPHKSMRIHFCHILLQLFAEKRRVSPV